MKVFVKVAKVTLTKWKISSVFWIRRLNITEMCVLSRLIYKINAVSINTPISHVVVLDSLIKFLGQSNVKIYSGEVWKTKTKRGPHATRYEDTPHDF